MLMLSQGGHHAPVPQPGYFCMGGLYISCSIVLLSAAEDNRESESASNPAGEAVPATQASQEVLNEA